MLLSRTYACFFFYKTCLPELKGLNVITWTSAGSEAYRRIPGFSHWALMNCMMSSHYLLQITTVVTTTALTTTTTLTTADAMFLQQTVY